MLYCLVLLLTQIDAWDYNEDTDFTSAELTTTNATPNNTDDAYDRNITKGNVDLGMQSLPLPSANMTVLLLPKTLNSGDKVTINCSIENHINSREPFNVHLMSQSNEILILFVVNFEEDSYSLSVNDDGELKLEESGLVQHLIQEGETNFTIHMTVADNLQPDQIDLNFFCNSAMIYQAVMNRDISEVKYLTVNNVTKLQSFLVEFGS